MNLKSEISFSAHPVITGFLTVLVTVFAGMFVAIATGFVTPEQVFAQVIGPGCGGCVPALTPVIPPIVIPIIPTIPIIPPVVGCMDSTATNYNPNATAPAACEYPVTSAPAITGCTDVTATNYNALATTSNPASCTYAPVCTEVPQTPALCAPYAGQFGIPATHTEGYGSWTINSCTNVPTYTGGCFAPTTPPITGCTDPTATNYNTLATVSNPASCTYAPVCTNVPQTPAVCRSYAGQHGIPATHTEGMASWTINSCTNVATYTGGCYAPTITTPVPGCTNPLATNFNSLATVDNGTCTLPAGGGGGGGSTTPTPGCTNPLATNFNSLATVDNGTCTLPAGGGGGGPVVVVPPPASVPGCTNPLATNFNSLATVDNGTCTLPAGGGGGGGGGTQATVLLTMLPLATAKPLAYLYLSQIPYTGVSMSPLMMVMYWMALIAWSVAVAYLVLFKLVPAVRRYARHMSIRIPEMVVSARTTLERPVREVAQAHAPMPVSVPAPEEKKVMHHVASSMSYSHEEEIPSTTTVYSAFDGFKSYGKNGVVSVEDIVKGLSRSYADAYEKKRKEGELPAQNVEPVYDLVETIVVPKPEAKDAISLNTFISTLVSGDRTGVFAGLREYTQKEGTPHKLIEQTVCMLDDVYRGRIDMSPCDEQTARLTARLDTPTLEKLVSALTTAIDTSYTDSVTGAKLALTRALSALGA